VVTVDGLGQHVVQVMGSVDLPHCSPHFWGFVMRTRVFDLLPWREGFLSWLDGEPDIVITPLGHEDCEICQGLRWRLYGSEPALRIVFHEGMKEVGDGG